MAKELIALANHGGGYLILGFEEQGGDWVPSTPRPPDLTDFNQDAVNGIVERYAEPTFHCDVHHVASEGEADEYPVVVVPGGTTVPIRACRDGPDQRFISQDTYYTRRPGPNSEPPRSARDWDKLLHRCLTNRREELLDDFRHLLEGKAGRRETSADIEERLAEWTDDSIQRWEQVCADRLEPGDERFQHGWWSVAYAIDPPAEIEGLEELHTVLQEAAGRETGWPPWWVPTRDELRPYAYDEALECWLGETRFGDAAHSDFWRASTNGEFFLVRGHQEDGNSAELEPGQYFDLVLPVWRTGECVLHAARLAEAVAENSDEIEILMRFRWTGLGGRQLTSWANQNRVLVGSYTSQQERVDSKASFLAGDVAGQLPTIVSTLTRPLYESFDLFTPPADMAEAELARLRQRG